MARPSLTAVGRVLVVGSIALLLTAPARPSAAPPARTGQRAAKAPKPAPPSPLKAEPAAPSRERQRALQSEQVELKQELAKMKRQLLAQEASRSEAADALRASEAAISHTNRRLRELAEARGHVERQIESLQQRSRAVAASRGDQQTQLADAMRREYELTLRDPLRALVAGENPGELARDAEYYGYLGRATSDRLGKLRERQAELVALEEGSRKKSDELAEITDDESRNRGQLQTEQARRKQTLDRLAKQIAAQRQSIDTLERDERRLGGLIDQLSKVLAEQARREAEREAARRAEAARAAREAAAREAARKAQPGKPPARPPDRVASVKPEPDLPAGGQFAQLRGRLPMPVTGEVTARFGGPRKVEGAGTAPTWKGLFIRAPAGAGVRAVAPGQVVFADWLRGFGNLLVIDHGEGYLSVYGNNESLLRNVGDRIAVGDTVASVGNTGGNEQTGLYFELRFQGRPFDPLKWVAAR